MRTKKHCTMLMLGGLQASHRRWAWAASLLMIQSLCASAVFACEPMTLQQQTVGWIIKISPDTQRLPSACDGAFAQILDRLRASSETKVWVERILDAPDVSSLNIAKVAGLSSQVENALLGHGITRWRIRLAEYRLPAQDRTYESEIARIVIRVE